jgi:hypothetical protein
MIQWFLGLIPGPLPNPRRQSTKGGNAAYADFQLFLNVDIDRKSQTKRKFLPWR